MLKFRNVSGSDVFVPEINKTVKGDQVADVDGSLATEHEDAYEVKRPDGQARLWPKAHWENVTTLKRKPKTDENEE